MTASKLPRNRTNSTLCIAGVYTRISDDRESEEAGVTRQNEDCRELAKRRGLPIYGTYTDNDTGASTRSNKPRPEYDQLLADAKAGFIHFIIAYSSSRLTRRPLELEGQIQLAEKYGVQFLYVKSPSFDLNTADGRQIARILAAADAAVAERTGELVARATLARAQSGRNHGGRRSYGFLADGVTVDLTEAAGLRKMAERVLSGVPCAALSRDLNEREEPTVSGARWTAVGVKQVLIKPRCAGITVNNGEEVGRLAGESILPEDIWRAVVAKLNSPTVEWTDRRGQRRVAPRYSNAHAPRWLGTGIYRCICGATMNIQTGSADHETAYRCSLRVKPEGTVHVRRDAEALDRYVGALVVERMSQPDAVELLTPVAPAGIDVNALRIEVANLRQRQIDLGAEYAEGDIPMPAFKAAARRIADKLAKAQQQLDSQTDRSPLAPLINASDVAAKLAEMPLGDRREVVKRLMTVRILPSRRPRFDPRCIEVTWR